MNHIIGFIILFTSISVSAAPYYFDRDGRPLFPQDRLRTICGSNDMFEMKGASKNLQEMGGPVGRLEAWNGSSGHMCTGTLIGPDMYLTNRHCKASCRSIKVRFDYLEKSMGDVYRCKTILEVGGSNMNQDYMIIRLENEPGLKWGWYGVSADNLKTDSPLLMMHHPGGSPMKVSQKNCVFKKFSGGLLRHRCDTESGSSGTGILRPDYKYPDSSKIVAIHAFGGCNSSSASTNSGPAIQNLVKVSKIPQRTYLLRGVRSGLLFFV